MPFTILGDGELPRSLHLDSVPRNHEVYAMKDKSMMGFNWMVSGSRVVIAGKSVAFIFLNLEYCRSCLRSTLRRNLKNLKESLLPCQRWPLSSASYE